MRVIKAPNYYRTLVTVEKEISHLLKFIKQIDEYDYYDINTLKNRMNNCYKHFSKVKEEVSESLQD